MSTRLSTLAVNIAQPAGGVSRSRTQCTLLLLNVFRPCNRVAGWSDLSHLGSDEEYLLAHTVCHEQILSGLGQCDQFLRNNSSKQSSTMWRPGVQQRRSSS